jgi:CheY-like chemotaxis protein
MRLLGRSCGRRIGFFRDRLTDTHCMHAMVQNLLRRRHDSQTLRIFVALILMVDDERDACRLMQRLLSKSGHRVGVCHTARDAVQWLGLHQPDLALLHIKPWERGALAVLEYIRRTGLGTRVIAITANPASETLKAAFRLGIEDCLVKPLEIDELEQRINRVLGFGGAPRPFGV